MRLVKLLTAGITVAAALSFGGCAGDYGPKQTGGALLGGAAGGLVGSQFGSGTGAMAATGLGVLAGALLGSSAGRSLDRADEIYYAQRYNPQQVPRPTTVYFPPQPYVAAPAAPAYAPAAPVMGAGGCQHVGSGPQGEPTYACQAPNGAWYISR
jgi:predicted lipid-binding transport protein (Tim44 family)